MHEVQEYQHQNESSSQILGAVQELLANFEAYYGVAYNVTQRQVLAVYLSELEPGTLSELYGATLKVKLYAARIPLIEHFEEALEIIRVRKSFERVEPMYRLIEEQDSLEPRLSPEEFAEIIKPLEDRFRAHNVYFSSRHEA
jgi:hypothetical protein